MSAPSEQSKNEHYRAQLHENIPMTIVGFSGSVRNGTSCGLGTTLVPPSFKLILKYMST